MNAWVEVVATRASTVAQMGRAAALRRRGLRASFNGWLQAAAERRDAIALMSRAGAATNRGLKVAFNTWLAVAAERRAALALMRRAGAALRSAASGWRSTLGSRRRPSGAGDRADEARGGGARPAWASLRFQQMVGGGRRLRVPPRAAQRLRVAGGAGAEAGVQAGARWVSSEH